MRSSIAAAICLTAIVALAAERAAGVQWSAPAGWTSEGARPMRAATYRVAPAPGDKDAGECGVYFFGAGQGGTIEANIQRWREQLKGADGKTAEAKVSKRAINGLPVTTIESAGTYSGLGGPMAPGAPVSGYRLLGAIVEGPGGNVFVKFTGPAKTIAANQQQFEQLLSSMQKVQ